MNSRLAQLHELRNRQISQRSAITNRVQAESRTHLNTAEAQKFRACTDKIREIDADIANEESEIERSGRNDPETQRVIYRRGASLENQQYLTRDQKVTDWVSARGKGTSAPLNLHRYLKGIATGNWDGAEEERVLSVGTSTAGGHLVPTPLASNIIDLARNQTRVIQAGAVTVPMTSSTLKVPRLTGEAAPSWRAENASIVTGDLTFDAVTFNAKNLDRLIIVSNELLEDSDPSVADVIARSFAEVIALEIDRVALFGSGTAPEPRGLLNTSGITTTAHGTNGSNITNYDWFIDAAGTVLGNNFEPTAHIVAPRTVTSLSKLKDSQNAYLQPPAGMLPVLPTKQVPTNLTVGTSSDASQIFTGQWGLLAIGIRTDFALRVLTERYADNGQVGFLAHLRADVQVLQPSAFVVDTGVRA